MQDHGVLGELRHLNKREAHMKYDIFISYRRDGGDTLAQAYI